MLHSGLNIYHGFAGTTPHNLFHPLAAIYMRLIFSEANGTLRLAFVDYKRAIGSSAHRIEAVNPCGFSIQASAPVIEVAADFLLLVELAVQERSQAESLCSMPFHSM